MERFFVFVSFWPACEVNMDTEYHLFLYKNFFYKVKFNCLPIKTTYRKCRKGLTFQL